MEQLHFSAGEWQVAYCEELQECRRVMIMNYFGERDFSSARCHNTCDICQVNCNQVYTNDHTDSPHMPCTHPAWAFEQNCPEMDVFEPLRKCMFKVIINVCRHILCTGTVALVLRSCATSVTLCSRQIECFTGLQGT